MSNMVHCRACGKEIHAQALSCPSCGAPQAAPAQELPTRAAAPESAWLAWTAGVISIFGLLILVAALQPRDQDAIAGAAVIAAFGGFLAFIGLVNKKPGHTVNVVAATVAAVTVLFCGQWY